MVGGPSVHTYVFLHSPLILQIIVDGLELHFKKHIQWRINWRVRANEKNVVESEIPSQNE